MNDSVMKPGLMVAVAALGMLLATGCGYSKDIKEYPEPWQTLDPGQPRPRFPTPRVITEGGGQELIQGIWFKLMCRRNLVCLNQSGRASEIGGYGLGLELVRKLLSIVPNLVPPARSSAKEKERCWILLMEMTDLVRRINMREC